VGDLVGAQGASPLILGKTRNKTQKEEKPAGQEKQPPPLPPPSPPLAQGLDPPLI